MTELKRTARTLDRDFVVTPTPQELVGAVTQRIRELEDLSPEYAELSTKLGAFDFTDFAMWLERGERDTESDPAAHAEHLERAAVILHGANNIEAACTMLRRAARLAHGHDQVSESAAVQLLWKYGGEQAVNELRAELREEAPQSSAAQEVAQPAGDELSEVQKRYEEVGQELIALDKHDWFTNPKFMNKDGAPIYKTDEERAERMKTLRTEFQQLTDRRTQLRS